MVTHRSIAVALLFLSLAALTADVGRAPLAGGPPSSPPSPSVSPSPGPTAAPAPSPTPTPPAAACTGAPLTSRSQVQPNTAYCGGVAHAQIILANGDTWTGGEVTGNIPTGSQQGALQCGGDCTLVNMNVHDVPASFAALSTHSGYSNLIVVNGGRYSGAGSLGITSSGNTMHASGVEIDHNGATANCGIEGGGWKGVGSVTFDHAYVHDNNCKGLWSDINSANGSITNSRVVNNAHEGIFIEISNHWTISGNTVTGNGFKTNGNTCAWLWGGGITVASSSDVTVSGNTVANNCNGITGTQQNRPDGNPGLLQNLSVHDNVVTTSGVTGLAQDVGNDAIFTSGNNHFVHNSYKVTNLAGHWFSWLDCCWRTWTEWRSYGQDLTSSIS